MDEITRRRWLAGAGGTLAVPALGLGTGAAEQQRPNVLFILADDLGYADVSCYGRRDYRTPAVDRIAREGIRFLQAYANSAVCSATRTALITGRYQDRLAIGLEEPLASDVSGLPPSHPTLPSLLRAAGYETALIGKWHLGFPPDYGPHKSGYDHFYGILGGASDYFHHDRTLWRDAAATHEKGYLTDLFGDEAVASVERLAKGSKPFLISLHFNAPHWPWEGPNGQAETDRLVASKEPHAMQDFDGGTLKVYAEMVTRMDMQIGRVLDALDRAGIARNTIVVFTSDNGGERFSDTWPFTGKKSDLLEGGLRIPAVVRWPATIEAGLVSQQVIASMDWMPTFAAAAGTAPDPAYPGDGMSLLPHLARSAPDVARTLYWRYLHNNQEAVRDGNWKYLKIMDNTFLFDVVEDPLERANQKGRHPDVYQRLVRQWQSWNAGMLPYTKANFSYGFSGGQLADHYGSPPTIEGIQKRPQSAKGD